MTRYIPALFIFLLILTGGTGYAKNVKAESSGFSYPTSPDRLEDFFNALVAIRMEEKGKITWVQPIPPVIVVSPEKRTEIEAIGFEKIDHKIDISYHHLKTPLDKCNWLSVLVEYPLNLKIATAPWIKVPSRYGVSLRSFGTTPQGPNWDRILFSNYGPYYFPGQTYFSKELVTDDVGAWSTEPEVKRKWHLKDLSILYIAIAIEPPNGDAWLENMAFSHDEDDTFTFRIKAYRETNPYQIAYSSVQVRYGEILGFLTDFVAGLVSILGPEYIKTEQYEWIANEPVTDIDAWADFLVAYGNRSEQHRTCGNAPINQDVADRKDEIFTSLEAADPGNTVSMTHGSHYFPIFYESDGEWKTTIEEKPYMIFPLEDSYSYNDFYQFREQRGVSVTWIWEKAIEQRPDEPVGYIRLVSYCLNNGDIDKALEYYHRCEEIRPGYIVEKYGAGWKLDTPARLEFGLHVVMDYPDSPYTLASVIDGYESLGNIDAAIELAEDYVARHPSYYRMWERLIEFHHSEGNDELEIWAIKGYLDNYYTDFPDQRIARKYASYKARIAEINGDHQQRVNLLYKCIPPDYEVCNEIRLDIAEPLIRLDDPLNALYLIERFLGEIMHIADVAGDMREFHRDKYDRGVKLRNKARDKLCPGFDPSNPVLRGDYLTLFQLAELFDDELKDRKQTAMRESTDYTIPSDFYTKIRQDYAGKFEDIFTGKLINLWTSEASGDRQKIYSARNNLKSFDRYYRPYFIEAIQDPLHETYRAEADAAKVAGDRASQASCLLKIFPFQPVGDTMLLDIAEALYELEDYAAALYFVEYCFSEELPSPYGYFRTITDPERIAKIERASTLEEKIISVFWPDYDQNKVLDQTEYKDTLNEFFTYYDSAKEYEEIGDIEAAAQEFRRLLDEYPSTYAAREYVRLLFELDNKNVEAILEGKLIEIIIKETLAARKEENRSYQGGSLKVWGDIHYNDYLKTKYTADISAD